MNGPDDARKWRDIAEHLVHGHGANSRSLVGHAPTLDQLHFVHADTHAALASVGGWPPDHHTHPAPITAGWVDQRSASYRPFPPSISAQDEPFFKQDGFFPLPFDTGLPHTGCYPTSEADLTDWAAAVSSSRSGTRAITAQRHVLITEHAAAAAARWRTTADSAGLVAPRLPTQSAFGQTVVSRRRSQPDQRPRATRGRGRR